MLACQLWLDFVTSRYDGEIGDTDCVRRPTTPTLPHSHLESRHGATLTHCQLLSRTHCERPIVVGPLIGELGMLSIKAGAPTHKRPSQPL